VTDKPDTDRWLTPKALAWALGRFDLDPCTEAGGSHILAANTYSLDRGEDGLVLPWGGRVFCNPPYSQPLPWAMKLSQYPGPWVALVKLDPTTRWWAALQLAGPQTRLFRRRQRFERPEGGGTGGVANFASALLWHSWDLPEEVVPYLWPAGA
jgi:hypothetical protein